MTKPVIKWAGGKTQLLNNILPLIPEYKTYYEPFFGGGALFFSLEPKKAVINDFNKQLTNIYISIKERPSELKKALEELEKNHVNSNDYFFAKRKEFNKCIQNEEYSIHSAALFIYLNKAGFNGLYRLNSKGLLNTPSGKKEKVNLFDRDNFDAVSKALKNVKILSYDFEEACKGAREGDFVFFDSPYYNTFDTYQAGGFSKDDHIRLSKLFKRLSKKGVKCLLTNSNEEFIKDLYNGFDIQVVPVKRMINCDGKKRTGEEVIIKNF